LIHRNRGPSGESLQHPEQVATGRPCFDSEHLRSKPRTWDPSARYSWPYPHTATAMGRPMLDVRRREVIAVLGGMAAACSHGARAAAGDAGDRYLESRVARNNSRNVAAVRRGLSAPATSRAETWALNTAGRRIIWSGCPPWPTIWFAVRSLLSW